MFKIIKKNPIFLKNFAFIKKSRVESLTKIIEIFREANDKRKSEFAIYIDKKKALFFNENYDILTAKLEELYYFSQKNLDPRKLILLKDINLLK